MRKFHFRTGLAAFGVFALAAQTVVAAPAASSVMAAPLSPGRPAGLKEAQVSSSLLVFSGAALVTAGAGYLFSSSLGGSTDSTIIAINGGQTIANTPGSSTTATGTSP